VSFKILFVGDVHGKFSQWAELVERHRDDYDFIFQVGDFGLGFDRGVDYLIQAYQNQAGKAWFIRGNHDNPAVCKHVGGFIDDGSTMFNNRMMFVGGAWSIDHPFRILGIDMWEGEELSYDELGRMIDKYIEVKPEVMVTHTCPQSVAEQMFIRTGLAMGNKPADSRTEQALEAMFIEHQPKHWIFGHWHRDKTEIINGTQFTCLPELSTMSLEI
jgi:Icc-related predicted phosphoesterase